MLLGAHVSSSGGIQNSILNAEKLGVECLQTFLSAPQSYKIIEPDQSKIDAFFKNKSDSKVMKCFAHAIYLLNFASDKSQLIHLSKQNLIETLNISAKLKFDGVIIHIGSTKGDINEGIKEVARNISEVLEKSDANSYLFLENSAGSGNHIGSSFDHIVKILALVNDDRVKVCLDTQHMHAGGYKISEEPIKVVDEIIEKFGKKVQLIHLNDSKTEFNSKKDRHENLGEGLIGLSSLKSFISDSRFRDISCVLEVPGFEGKGPDQQNVEILKSFFQ